MLCVSEAWTAVAAEQIQPGDRVRLASGQEMLVSRIEAPFLGREGMIAFIEDTPERWFKQPLPQATEVEVTRPG